MGCIVTHVHVAFAHMVKSGKPCSPEMLVTKTNWPEQLWILSKLSVCGLVRFIDLRQTW